MKKRLHAINVYYLLGTVPLCLAVMVLTFCLVPRFWQKGLVIVAGSIIVFELFKKFWHLPRPRREYEELVPCELKLPEDYNVKIYTCPTMDRYDFLKRKVELLSPLHHKRGEDFKIAISPKFLAERGERFVGIAVMREIIRYQKAVQLKVFLGLVTPALLVICAVESWHVFDLGQRIPIAPGLLHFFGPLAVAASVVGFLLAWNKWVSGMDYKTDQTLKKYYPAKEIADYIVEWDRMMASDKPETGNEKSRQMEQFYVQQRVERL